MILVLAKNISSFVLFQIDKRVSHAFLSLKAFRNAALFKQRHLHFQVFERVVSKQSVRRLKILYLFEQMMLVTKISLTVNFLLR